MFIHDSMLLHLVPAVTLTAGLRLPFCQTLYLSDCCMATRSVPCSSNLPFCPGNPSEDRKKTKLILRLLQNVMKFLILYTLAVLTSFNTDVAVTQFVTSKEHVGYSGDAPTRHVYSQAITALFRIISPRIPETPQVAC